MSNKAGLAKGNESILFQPVTNGLMMFGDLKMYMCGEDTVKCRYNAIQYERSEHNLITGWTQKRRASYGVSFMRILEKTDRVITAPHCIMNFTCLFVWVYVSVTESDRWHLYNSQLGSQQHSDKI